MNFMWYEYRDLAAVLLVLFAVIWFLTDQFLFERDLKKMKRERNRR